MAQIFKMRKVLNILLILVPLVVSREEDDAINPWQDQDTLALNPPTY